MDPLECHRQNQASRALAATAAKVGGSALGMIQASRFLRIALVVCMDWHGLHRRVQQHDIVPLDQRSRHDFCHRLRRNAKRHGPIGQGSKDQQKATKKTHGVQSMLIVSRGKLFRLRLSAFELACQIEPLLRAARPGEMGAHMLRPLMPSCRGRSRVPLHR